MSEKKKELTLGEQRVHLTFNPSDDDIIGQVKKMAAVFIDLCNDISAESPDKEVKRCMSLAMTNLETAQMYAVKGIAKTLK